MSTTAIAPVDRADQTSLVAPARSLDQRLAALKVANDVRVERAKLKRRLRMGAVSAAQVLADPPGSVQSMKVFDLLVAIPRVGRVKAARILSSHRISQAKTIGGMTERQRGEIVAALAPNLPLSERNAMDDQKLFRQGDVLVIPTTDPIPAAAKLVPRENGRVVLAHGEVTGHHHSIVEADVELVTADQANELRMWLSVTTAEAVALTHQEHDTIMIPPGTYKVVRQREYAPDAIRNVAD